jgi:hypothetical protein
MNLTNTRCLQRDCPDCRATNATSSANLPGAKPPQRTFDVDVEPMLPIAAGITKLTKLAHVGDLVVRDKASSALPD